MPAFRLSTPIGPRALASRGVQRFAPSPDGAFALYLANEDPRFGDQVYYVRTDGARVRAIAPRRIGLALDPALVQQFEISPDGRRLVYRMRTDGVHDRLFSVPVDGSAAPRELNAPLVAGGGLASPFLFAPDSARVLYRADQDVDQRFDLYSVPVDGSASPLMLDTPRANADVEAGFQLLPDGAEVAYRADSDVDGVVELYRAPIDGTGPTLKLNAPLSFPWQSLQSDVHAAGDHLIHRVDRDTSGVTELYVSDLRPRHGLPR